MSKRIRRVTDEAGCLSKWHGPLCKVGSKRPKTTLVQVSFECLYLVYINDDYCSTHYVSRLSVFVAQTAPLGLPKSSNDPRLERLHGRLSQVRHDGVENQEDGDLPASVYHDVNYRITTQRDDSVYLTQERYMQRPTPMGYKTQS